MHHHDAPCTAWHWHRTCTTGTGTGTTLSLHHPAPPCTPGTCTHDTCTTLAPPYIHVYTTGRLTLSEDDIVRMLQDVGAKSNEDGTIPYASFVKLLLA